MTLGVELSFSGDIDDRVVDGTSLGFLALGRALGISCDGTTLSISLGLALGIILGMTLGVEPSFTGGIDDGMAHGTSLGLSLGIALGVDFRLSDDTNERMVLGTKLLIENILLVDKNA